MFAAVLLFAATLLVVASPATARTAVLSADIVTVLQPGDNLVGWIAAAEPVMDLFAVVPEIEAVWTWDTRRSSWRVASPRVPEALHSLRMLTPGMGLRIRLGGDSPVEWTRPAVPARGLVALRTGPQLVAWAGPDNSSIEHLAKGIGVSLMWAAALDTTGGGWRVYDPRDAASAEAFPAVSRGDALWVNVSRDISWLQPTGVLPLIEFPGGASQKIRDKIRVDLESVLEFFADNYAIQADFANLTVYVPKDVGSLARSHYGERVFHGQERELQEQWDRSLGWAGVSALVVKQHLFEGEAAALSTGTITLAHEYWHVMQQHLQNGNDADTEESAVPVWLLEGTATYIQDRYADAERIGYRTSYDELIQRVFSSMGAASLEDTHGVTPREDRYYLSYSLGARASQVLVQHAGEDSLVEFWRLLSQTVDGLTGTSKWFRTFADAFGVNVPDFYSAFCHLLAGRKTVGNLDDSVPLCHDEDVQIVSGTLVDEDGAPVEGAWVSVGRLGAPLSHIDSIGGRTSAEGEFQIRIAEGNARLGLWVRFDRSRRCDDRGLWYGIDGLVEDESQSIAVPFHNHVAVLNLRAPSSICHILRGVVVGPGSTGLPGIRVSAVPAHWTPQVLAAVAEPKGVRTALDGSFVLSVLPGEYRLMVEFDAGCLVWYVNNNKVTALINNGSAISAWSGDVDGIHIVTLADACASQIDGRVVDADRNGVPNMSIYVRTTGDQLVRRVRTQGDGSFVIGVPVAGTYRLTAGDVWDRRGCAMSLASVRSYDIVDVVIEVMGDSCDGS